MSDRELQIKIGLARAGLAGDAAAAARTIQQNLSNLDIDLKIDDKGVRLAKQAIDELANETLETARQAKFLKEAYNFKDDEIQKVIAQMGRLERSTRDAKQEGGALQEIYTGFLRRAGESAWQGLINSVQRLGQAIAGMVADSVRGFVEFEGLVKQAGVISGSLGTEDFEALGDEVERLGIVTSKTPEQIARTSVNLSRAGFSARETTQALEGISRASEATGDDMDVVGDIVAKTYRTFQAQFEKAGMDAEAASKYISNAIVATANNTNTSVTSIGESLAYAGPQFAAAGQDLGDLLVMIGLLGDAGKQGSAAGTGLAEMLSRLKTASAAGASEFGELARGSKRAVEAFNEIGTEVRNTDGTMKGLLDILPSIQSKLNSLNAVDRDLLSKVLFGVQGEGALVPLLNTTAERMDDVTNKITVLSQEGEGAAMASGRAMLTGLSGALDLIDGSIKTLRNDFAGALAPALEAVVRSAMDIINTLLKTEGLFDPLLEASQRFATVLSGSEEVAGDLTDQVVNFATVAVEQLASVIDAVTAFIATEGNVSQMAGAFEDLVTVLGALATVTRVVIALADGIGSLRTQAEGLPVIGENVERWLQWPTPMNALVEAFRAVGEVFGSLSDIVIGAIDGMLERMGQMLPVLNPLIDRVQGLLGRLGGGAEMPDTSTATSLDTFQEEDGPDNRNPNRPAIGSSPAPADPPTPPPPPEPEPEAVATLETIADKYRALTATLETEQANQTRALVEGGKSREEIEAKEREFFQRRIALNEQKLGELRAIDQSALEPEEAAKVRSEILSLDQQLANDRLKLAEDTRKSREDATKAETKAVEDAAKEQERATKEAEKAREDAAKAEEQRLKALEEQRKAYIDGIQKQMEAEERLAAVALESAEAQLSGLGRVAEALERQQSLLQAQGDLAQAVFDLESSLNEARQEQLGEILNDEEASQSEKRRAAQALLRLTEEQFAREKQQLEARQALELQQFDLSQQQAALAEQRGIKEQEMALKRLELQRLEIANEIELARLRGDTRAVEIGEAQLGLLAEQAAAQQDYIASLQQEAALSAELGQGQRAALVANQAQQDIDLAQSQRGTAEGLQSQLADAGLGRGVERQADRLGDRADRALNAELRQARSALPGLTNAGVNPQVAAMAATPTTGLGAMLDPRQLAQPIVAELQALGGAINTLAASPRQLTVQTPDPVADTSRILGDITRMQTAGVNP